MIDEGFMKNQRPFSDFKLRLSYGVTGNQGIGDFDALSLVTAQPYGASPVPCMPRSIATTQSRSADSAARIGGRFIGRGPYMRRAPRGRPAVEVGGGALPRRRCVQRAVALNASYAPAYETLGLVQWREGHTRDAVQAFGSTGWPS